MKTMFKLTTLKLMASAAFVALLTMGAATGAAQAQQVTFKSADIHPDG